MIQQTSFLGLSLRTRTRRRSLVLAYYAVVIALLAIPLSMGKMLPAAMFMQMLTLGGFFGGIIAGPIKSYSGTYVGGRPDGQGPLQLNLSGRRILAAIQPLDERETYERDHAHYTAYRILRWTIGLAAVLFFLGMNWAPRFLTANSPTLLWALVVFVLSLPQSVILWTEPEPMPDGTLALCEPG